jgi:ABC-2 type transport system permease protein
MSRRSSARKYVSLGQMALAQAITYPRALLLRLLTQIFSAVALFALWQAIADHGGGLGDYTLAEIKAYVSIALLTNMVMTFAEGRIAWRLLDGSIAMELLKPLDFQRARLAETIGSGVFESIVAAAIIGLFGLVYGGIALPHAPVVWLLVLVSLLLSLLIKFSIIYLTGLLCFWTSSALGMTWLRIAIMNLFSGALIPLTFFPAWLQMVAFILPFQGIVYIPASLYLERSAGPAALQLIGLQALWVIVLWVCGRALWSRAVRQVTIHGG